MNVVLQFLGTWYNIVFVLPLMICGLFMLLQLALGLLDQGADHDGHGHELEAGGHHDVDADCDVHADFHADPGGALTHAHGSSTAQCTSPTGPVTSNGDGCPAR